MKSVLNKIRLEMTKDRIRTTVSICKGDTNSRQLYITLLNSGAVYEVPETAVAVLLATKPDGKKIYNDCSVNGNEIVFDVTTQLIAYEGDVECQIELSDVNGTILTSPVFIIRVYEKTLDSTVLESINEYKALTAFCTNAETAAARAEENAVQIDEQLKATGQLLTEKQERVEQLAEKTEKNADAAQKDASTAVEMAGRAEKYAEKAGEHAQRMELDAALLENYADIAKENAQTAKENKTATDTNAANAALSETKAKESEANARQSELNAKQYETQTANNLSLCSDYADEASEYADRAGNREYEASEWKKMAQEYAEEAGTYKTAAESAKNQAQTSEKNAKSYAQQALQTKNSALTEIGKAKTDGVSVLENRTEELLESLPQDYVQMSEKLDNHEKKIDDVNERIREVVDTHNTDYRDLDTRLDGKMNSIYTTNTGEKYINDCQSGGIRNMEVHGKTYQKHYNGYQLLDLSRIKKTTKDGITVECMDGNAIRVSGAPTIEEGYVSLTFPNIVHENIINVADTYTISLSGKKKGVSFAVLTQEDGALTFPMSSEYVSKTRQCTITRRGLIINISYDVGEIDFVFSAQLEKGSVVHAYEPYTGGIQSPNVAYPQEMTGIDRINVRMTGKNLAGILVDKTTTTAGLTVVRDATNQTITLNGTATGPSGTSLLNGTCVYTGEKKGTLKAGTYCFWVNAKVTFFLYQAGTETAKGIMCGNGKAITFEEDFDYCDMQIRWSTGAVFDNTVVMLQFEEGSTPTEYAPYEEQAFSMVPPKPLYAVGNYKDFCDVENGVWRYETDMHTIAEMVLKDTAGTQKNIVAGVDVSAISGIDAANMEFTELLSDKFAPGEENGENTMMLNSGRNTVLFYRKYNGNDAETVENVILLYPLAKPHTQDIEADVLEKLRLLHTCYGATHVSVTDGNGNDIFTRFAYHFNLKPYVEYVKEQLADDKELIYGMQEKQSDADVGNAWALINAEYAAAVTDFS